MKRAMFIGRWQPFHNGHKWLIEQKLSEGVPVLIAVRDIPPDDKNPLTTGETMAILNAAYEGHDAHVVSIPDIESVNYGRGVGYEINEFCPPSNIGYISATEVRRKIREGDTSWKDNVDEKVHTLVEQYLGEK